MPQYNTGRKKRANQTYQSLIRRAHQLRKKGQMEAAQKLKQQAQKLPSVDPQDPNYRRLRYCRYADDFALAFYVRYHYEPSLEVLTPTLLPPTAYPVQIT